jgi:hypothetical protein
MMLASLSLKYPEQSKISFVLGEDLWPGPGPVEWLSGEFGGDYFVELVSSPPVFRTSSGVRSREVHPGSVTDTRPYPWPITECT